MSFVYVIHCSLYVQYTYCNCVFTLAGPAHLARISKIMTRQKKTCVNVVNNDNVRMPLSRFLNIIYSISYHLIIVKF